MENLVKLLFGTWLLQSRFPGPLIFQGMLKYNSEFILIVVIIKLGLLMFIWFRVCPIHAYQVLYCVISMQMSMMKSAMYMHSLSYEYKASFEW